MKFILVLCASFVEVVAVHLVKLQVIAWQVIGLFLFLTIHYIK